LKSIFYHPSWLLHSLSALRSFIMARRFVGQTRCRTIDWCHRGAGSLAKTWSEKLTCEGERYIMHKHFYGNWRAKFSQKPIRRKRSGFYSARLLESTGYQILDEAALKLFRQWRFKPDTVSHVRIPVWDALSGRA
jgi:hypothetical protein